MYARQPLEPSQTRTEPRLKLRPNWVQDVDEGALVDWLATWRATERRRTGQFSPMRRSQVGDLRRATSPRPWSTEPCPRRLAPAGRERLRESFRRTRGKQEGPPPARASHPARSGPTLVHPDSRSRWVGYRRRSERSRRSLIHMRMRVVGPTPAAWACSRRRPTRGITL